MIKLRPGVSEVVGNSILVTGVARSGTTMISTLIHSCVGVELAYEPPLLFSLFSLINTMPPAEWKLLFETYLFEDYLMNALAGRNFNYRTYDESYTGKVKSMQEIATRLLADGSDVEIRTKALKARIGFKLPDILYSLREFLHHYPNVKIVVVIRNPADTIASLLAKGWYSGQGMLPWSIDNRWLDTPELQRCESHYLQYNIFPPWCDTDKWRVLDHIILVDYDQCLINPQATAERIFTTLNLNPGPKTDEIIGNIEPRIGHSEGLDIPPELNKLYQGVLEWGKI